MSHLTFEELATYAETGSMSREAEHHAGECAFCRERISSYSRFEQALRRIPLDEAPPGLTKKVLTQLGISEADSVLWPFLKNLAPLMGLAIIAGVLYGVLSLLGAFNDSTAGQSLLASESLYRSAENAITSGMTGFNAWVAKWLSPGSNPATVTLVIFFVLFLLGVGILDKYLFGPLLRRRISH